VGGCSHAAQARETFVSKTPDEQARERLLAAIDTVDAEVAAVALWACALSGFAQPVPNYDTDEMPFQSHPN
jgi:hypothetical protein